MLMNMTKADSIPCGARNCSTSSGARNRSTDDCALPSGLRARLRILSTTDLHMHLTSHDYYTDRADHTVGLTRTATLIHAARAEAAHQNALTLLLDNGDGMQGTPMGEVTTNRQNHPLMQAFEYLQFDAIGLGNHDFNFGLSALDVVLEQASCPVVCSNMRRLGQVDRTQPYAFLDRQISVDGTDFPIRIGILSFLPPHTARWDIHLLAERVEIDDILNSAQHFVQRLQQAGCDLIVALAHTGLRSSRAFPTVEDAAIPLAAIDGIDVVIAGHTHLLLPGSEHAGMDHVNSKTGTIHGKPAIMAGSAGTHLGVIDLELHSTPEGRWQVSGQNCALHPIARRHLGGKSESLAIEDPQLVRLLAPHHRATRDHMRLAVGHVDQPLHSYFTYFAPDRSLVIVASAQAAALRPMLAHTEISDMPLLSAAAPGKFGGRAGPLCYTDVPAGPLSLRHVADLHIFPNTLQAVILGGAQVLDWLEMSASLFQQIRPGSSGQMLVDPDMAGYAFDVLHGLQYRIDLSAPPRYWPDGSLRNAKAHRIVSATYQGVSVLPGQKFVIALNNYRANGGGNVAALDMAHALMLPRLSIRDALRAYIAKGALDDPLSTAPPPWTFSAMPGTSVTALTGPGALNHMCELKDSSVKVEPVGIDENGFLTLRVNF